MKKKILKSLEIIASNIMKLAILDFGDESQVINEELIKQYIITEGLEFDDSEGCFSEQIDTIFGEFQAGFPLGAHREAVQLVINYIKEYKHEGNGYTLSDVA
jgi:hypothetical protein